MNKLKTYLKISKNSQREFAEMIGTTPNNLNSLINGKSLPSLKLAYEIEKMTGGLVKMHDWLIEDSNENEKKIGKV